MPEAIAFSDESLNPPVRGFLHSPANPRSDALVLTHGAGSNSNAPLLVALSEIFAQHGFAVLRCELPFRQERRTGPPFSGNAERDRAGLRNAVSGMSKEMMRKEFTGRIFLGGHSYGGRQATMMCAAEPNLVSGLLLLSYPLHPPGKPEQLRTQHWRDLRMPSLFVQGTRDPFGSVEEFRTALPLIAARTEFMTVEGVGHDLGFKGKTQRASLPEIIFAKFREVFD